MAVNEPIDPRVRLAVAQWPDDAPRGAVSTFCAEHGISRKSFYALRNRAMTDGPAAVLEPRTRRPTSSPSTLTEEVKDQAVAVRKALEDSGLDHGPISVHEKMRAMGLEQVPSTASLARIFRDAGVARLEPKKKPRSAWRRFVYPAPNACWQLDATGYVLTGGRTCVIFQLIDDHSRYAVGSHVAAGETAEAAIAVFDKAVAAHGVSQKLLSDNGIALNPSRRGIVGQLVAHVERVGVQATTGKPYKPTTQGGRAHDGQQAKLAVNGVEFAHASSDTNGGRSVPAHPNPLPLQLQRCDVDGVTCSRELLTSASKSLYGRPVGQSVEYAPIPPLTSSGDLPRGRFCASVAEFEKRFVADGAYEGSTTREQVWTDFNDLVDLIRLLKVRIPAVFVGGGFVTSSLNPTDIDAAIFVDTSKIARPETFGRIADYVSDPKMDRGLRVDAFVIPWHPDGTQHGGHREYLPARGSWDDFWQRKVAKDDRHPPQRWHAMPVRGYVEVIIDGYR